VLFVLACAPLGGAPLEPRGVGVFCFPTTEAQAGPCAPREGGSRSRRQLRAPCLSRACSGQRLLISSLFLKLIVRGTRIQLLKEVWYCVKFDGFFFSKSGVLLRLGPGQQSTVGFLISCR